MRCFLAIEVPDSASLCLIDAGCCIREADPSWAGEKWVTREVMHVTVKFFGDVEGERVDALLGALTEMTVRQQGFPLRFSELCAVPAPNHASMIWARVEDATGRCAKLAAAADRIAVETGCKGESKPFAPHLTLVRARRPRAVSGVALSRAAERSGLVQLAPMSVPSATLFSSELTRSGPIHVPLGRLEFRSE